jgi:hypothetical protein
MPAAIGDAGTVKLIAYGGPGNAQLSTDLAERPTLAAQVGRTLNVYRATVTSLGAASGSSGFAEESR